MEVYKRDLSWDCEFTIPLNGDLPSLGMRDINRHSRRMPWLKTGATHYHAQLGLLDKGREIKELVVCRVLLNLIPRIFRQKMRELAPLVILVCWT